MFSAQGLLKNVKSNIVTTVTSQRNKKNHNNPSFKVFQSLSKSYKGRVVSRLLNANGKSGHLNVLEHFLHSFPRSVT